LTYRAFVIARNHSGNLTLPLNRTALPVVKTNHYDDIQKTLTGTLNPTGTYTFTVRQIRQILDITVAYPDVANAAVASSDRVWSHNGRVYITPAHSGTVHIYNVTGNLVETLLATSLQIGEIGRYFISLQGYYFYKKTSDILRSRNIKNAGRTALVKVYGLAEFFSPIT
jgi:hypothetical protein